MFFREYGLKHINGEQNEEPHWRDEVQLVCHPSGCPSAHFFMACAARAWDIQSPGFPICGFQNDFQTLGHLTKVFSRGGIASWLWGSYGRLPL